VHRLRAVVSLRAKDDGTRRVADIKKFPAGSARRKPLERSGGQPTRPRPDPPTVNSRSETLRNTLFSSVGVYTEYLLGMLVSILIARHLGPADFGIYSLVVWLVACGVTLTNAGTTTTTIKFVAELRGSQRTELIPTLMDLL